MKLARYNTTTGEITGEYSEQVADTQAGDGEAMARVADDVTWLTHYINPLTTKANQRDVSPCTPSTTSVPADGVSAVSLTQMRDGTRVQTSGPAPDDVTLEGDNASGQWTFAIPGQYTIRATAKWPALPKVFVINAT